MSNGGYLGGVRFSGFHFIKCSNLLYVNLPARESKDKGTNKKWFKPHSRHCSPPSLTS